MKKIALPMADNKVSPQFENCRYFAVYETDKNIVVHRYLLPIPHYRSGAVTEWLAGNHITDLIVCGIDHGSIEKLSQHKVHVFVDASRKKPGQLVADFLNGMLQTNIGEWHQGKT